MTGLFAGFKQGMRQNILVLDGKEAKRVLILLREPASGWAEDDWAFVARFEKRVREMRDE